MNLLILSGIGLAGLAYYYTSGPLNNTTVKASDGREYTVQNLPDKKDAAEMLATIRSNLIRLVNYIKKYDEPPFKRLVANFNPDNLSENDVTASTTSYSENKGERIVVCMRQKAKPYKFIDMNTVMFVLTHELAHLMTSSYGHGPEFWTNFKKLLHEAIEAGVYEQVNYYKNPVNYCGMDITDSPLDTL